VPCALAAKPHCAASLVTAIMFLCIACLNQPETPASWHFLQLVRSMKLLIQGLRRTNPFPAVRLLECCCWSGYAEPLLAGNAAAAECCRSAAILLAHQGRVSAVSVLHGQSR